MPASPGVPQWAKRHKFPLNSATSSGTRNPCLRSTRIAQKTDSSSCSINASGRRSSNGDIARSASSSDVKKSGSQWKNASSGGSSPASAYAARKPSNAADGNASVRFFADRFLANTPLHACNCQIHRRQYTENASAPAACQKTPPGQSVQTTRAPPFRTPDMYV